MDDAKKIILARRARFIAATLASVAVGACDKPRACLEPPMVTTTPSTPTRPSVCLSAVRIPRDAGDGDAILALLSSDAGAGDAAIDAPADGPTDAARKPPTSPVGPPSAAPRACLTK